MTSAKHPNHQRRGQAVVCGASMAGILAARVVSEFYDTVVVERDALPDDASQLALTETFLRTIELLDIQSVWLRPAQITRIVAAYRITNHATGPGPHPSPKPRPALLACPKERD